MFRILSMIAVSFSFLVSSFQLKLFHFSTKKQATHESNKKRFKIQTL